MTEYVFTPASIPSLAVEGEQARFPIRRVYCVGRNYADHAREMGHNPDREPPFFFSKPADAVVPASGDVPYPSLTKELHYEVELVVAIGKGGKDIARPAEFLVDAAGTIRWVNLTDDIRVRARPESVLAAIDRL